MTKIFQIIKFVPPLLLLGLCFFKSLKAVISDLSYSRTPATAAEYYEAGKTAALEGISTRESSRQIALLCESYISLSRAAQLSPHQAQFQIALADVEGILANPAELCRQSFSADFFPASKSSTAKTEPIDRVTWATLLAPWSGADQYSAALVYLSLNERTKALSLLKTVQEYNPLFSPAQRLFAFNLVRSEDDLKLIIPRRYPEVVGWINYFSAYREGDYVRYLPVLSSALAEAVDDLSARYSAGVIPERHYQEYLQLLSSLPILADRDSLRKQVDNLRSRGTDDDGLQSWRDFLRVRASLSRVPVLKSFVMHDSTPAKSSLYKWKLDTSKSQAVFDSFGKSVGFYLPKEARIQLIVLQNAQGYSSVNSRSIELLSSSDNVHFTTVTPREVVKWSVDGKETVALLVDDSVARVYKIRFVGDRAESRFGNVLRDLIQVYG